MNVYLRTRDSVQIITLAVTKLIHAHIMMMYLLQRAGIQVLITHYSSANY